MAKTSLDPREEHSLNRVSNRATRARIDLDAIAENVRIVRATIAPSATVMAVVKANAYGHGSRMVAETALAAGASSLGVATLDEALVLRGYGIVAPIQVLGPVTIDEVNDAATNDIGVSAGSMEFISGLASSSVATPLVVHLKIDTGMRRFGIMSEDALTALALLRQNPSIVLGSVFTHFGQADEVDLTPTELQHRRFDEVLKSAGQAGFQVGISHAANSAGLLKTRAFDRSIVRLGIALYGISPSTETSLFPGMRAAMTVVSQVQRVFTLAHGDGVSYGATYRATGPVRAGLVPIGYADGYLRSLSNCGVMKIGGQPARVIGRVCMDQTVVELPSGVDVVVNNEVIVAGGGESGVPFEEIANRAGTIPYEIVAILSARVPRVYFREGQIVAIEDLNGLHKLS